MFGIFTIANIKPVSHESVKIHWRAIFTLNVKNGSLREVRICQKLIIKLQSQNAGRFKVH